MPNTNPPKQSILQKLNKKSISAKDIAAQFWCEKQMELSYMYGFKTNPAMDKGSAIHQRMQREVYKELTVPPTTWPDSMYKQAYDNVLTINTLLEKGMARELKIYGAVNGYLVVGQIDELRISGGRVMIVENKTTRSAGGPMSPQYTKPHIVQIMMYRKMLGELKQRLFGFNNLDVYYKLGRSTLSPGFVSGLRDMGFKEEMLSIKPIYEKMFNVISKLPELSDSLLLHYVNSETREQVSEITIDYKDESINKDLIYALKYWNGQRQASPVPEEEKWKCRSCRFFGDKCLVWYQK